MGWRGEEEEEGGSGVTMSCLFPGDITNELVRHFLIETSPRGVKLKGCPNEPNFGECPGVVPTQPFGSLSFAGLSEQSNQVSGRAPAPASWGQSKKRTRDDAGQGEDKSLWAWWLQEEEMPHVVLYPE